MILSGKYTIIYFPLNLRCLIHYLSGCSLQSSLSEISLTRNSFFFTSPFTKVNKLTTLTTKWPERAIFIQTTIFTCRAINFNDFTHKNISLANNRITKINNRGVYHSHCRYVENVVRIVFVARDLGIPSVLQLT